MSIFHNRKLIGIVFLALIATGLWLVYAVFTKKFAEYDEVRLTSSKIGLQLPERADVKVRGVIVGEVLETEVVEDGVDLTLGIYPDKIGQIPANVQGAIYPKTLFGEKYVELEIQGDPRGHLAAGDHISQTKVATEVEQVLSDLYPLLSAVQPGDLKTTLDAMATALEGRGDRIGDNLETLDAYLKRMNPEIPKLIEDIRLTAQVSNLYADVMPQIVETLRNTIVTGNTLEQQEKQLQALFGEVTAFSNVARPFLDQNEDVIIRLGEVTQAQMNLLAKYAPEYPCFLQGVVNAHERFSSPWRGFMLHINLELLPNQPRGWTPADRPVNGAKLGPYCGTLPNPPYSQSNPLRNPPNVNDGVETPTGKGTQRVAPFAPVGSYLGTPMESDMLKALIGPSIGVAPTEVSDLAAMLLAPMARGAEVSVG